MSYGSQRLAAEPAIKSSYGFQAPAAEPAVKSYGSQKLVAEPAVKSSYGFQAPAAEPAIKSSYGFQAPAAEPAVKSSYGSQKLSAEPAIKSSYGIQAPAAEPTRRHIKKTAVLAEPITRRSYNQASEPTTTESSYGSYQTETLAAEPVRQMKTNGYQTPAVKPAIHRQVKSSRLAAPKTRASSGYQTPAAMPAIRRRIQTKTLMAAKSNARRLSAGGYQTSTPAADSTILNTYGSYQAPAAEPTIRRHMKTTRVAAETTRASFGYQTTTPAADEQTTLPSDDYQTFEAAPTTRSPNRKIKTKITPLADSTIFDGLFGSYQAPAAEPATRRHMEKLQTRQSYGFQATTPAAEPITTESSYGQSLIAAEPSTPRRAWYYKKVYIDEEHPHVKAKTISTPINQQQSY